MKKNNFTTINQLDISWYVTAKKVTELDEMSQQHIEEMIAEGYTSGELHVCYGKDMEKESSGWWSIVNWKDIALELYNFTKEFKTHGMVKDDAKLKEAIKHFDDNWN